jgi:hypothetical protein
MPPEELSAELRQLLHFRPWPPGDTFSPYVIGYLDKTSVLRLQAVALELNNAILTAQLKANVQQQEILKNVGR